MSNEQLLIASIPGTIDSLSGVAKRKTKWWAKRLTSVATPASTGYDYEGEFLPLTGVVRGMTRDIECRAGDVIAHYDSADCAGIVVIVPSVTPGKGALVWVETDSSKGWAAGLAATAREYLALDPAERVRRAAKFNLCLPGGPAAQAHWEALAAEPPAEAPTEIPDIRAAGIVAVRRLMAEYGLTVEDLA